MFFINQAYYAPDDGGVSLFLLLVIVGLVLAIIWIVNYEPKKGKSQNEFQAAVDKAFEELRKYAQIYERDNILPPLDETQRKVNSAIKEYFDSWKP